MGGLGRALVIMGAVIVVLGLALMLAGRFNLPLGRLPGDITWRGKNTVVYFPIKDDAAQLRVVMFRLKAQLLRFRPENGMQVVARGRVSLYEQRGELQLMAEYLEPQGAGALQVAFEQLKAKLAAEGLFDQDRKKPLPLLPRRIGVVTSSRGAAIQDILNILRRRHESVGVLIYPAQVQGADAAREASAGIKFFNRARGKEIAVDVIIIARGGGSLED